MKVTPLGLDGACVIDTTPRVDQRGTFSRLFCDRELREVHHGKPIVQINHSLTLKRGALRGLHFQRSPAVEGKLVRCLAGAIFDVVVDLRRGSGTFLQWHGERLSGQNARMLYIPEGCAHGFQALEANVEVLYLHTGKYSPSHEGGVRHDDPLLGIDWPLPVTDLSDRDGSHPLLKSDFAGLVL